MDRNQLPLNALRAFEASARHLSFTRAGLELRVSQGAVSHQVAHLEDRLGAKLFRRLPRGLALTDDGQALLPIVSHAFDRVSATLDQFADGRFREVLNIGVVGTFAVGWLLERLDGFQALHPNIDLRISTNNNRVGIAGDGLDMAIRFGDGAWHGMVAVPLMSAPLSVLCSPALAARVTDPAQLARETLLRSYRADEWPRWFEAAGLPCPPLRGPVFDSSILSVHSAMNGHGIALAPAVMFSKELAEARLAQPSDIVIDAGNYWLTQLTSRAETQAMRAFRNWLIDEALAAA